MGKLTHKLQEAVKKLSYKTTVDQLKKKGIQKVNVVGLDRIVALIEAAVHRTLRARMAGFDGVQKRGEIADATREEFLKLLHSNESLERARDEVEEEKHELASEVTRLRTELRSVQSSLDDREATHAREERQRAAAVDAALDEEVQAILAQHGVGNDPKAAAAVGAIMDVVRARLVEERRLASEARRNEYQKEIDLLNRRLSKLNGALSNTERELHRVMRAKSSDDGIASIYSEVQGLNEGDGHFAQKKELMASIFEANRDLQREA